MRASHSKLNDFVAITIVCMLLIGVAVAQPIQKEKGKKAIPYKIDKESKITPQLTEKIASVKAEEETPVIIFFKKKEKTEVARAQAQSAVISAVEWKGGKIKHKYKLIDAVSARLPAGKVAELVASADIERVYYDEIVSLPPEPPETAPALANSTQTIGADHAWNTLGYTGTNVTVAVLDTGINYTHPDLGGCFGAGCKVLGGYDFAYDDTNPDDVEGHGTHVAGIIAANGSLKGVAPDAKLLAVKVLDDTGSGSTSDIIAGIDWAVSNGADIISMSIGGFGQPNDEFASPITIVADAAVDKGVVVVIAAGNEGPGTGVTNILATSRKVITIGASDSSSTVAISDDTIASFSSRGPSAFGRLDPEVVGPGVSINSTIPGDAYGLKSGTSMATPHVSGATALILQKNSSLTPAQVRRILMHTASNLTASDIHVFEKGAGIINVTKALIYNTSATINGDDRWEESVLPGFSAIAKLKLTNNNNYPVNFTFVLEGITDLEGDNSLASSTFSLPSSVLVPAMATTSVDINFTAPLNANPAIYGTTLAVSNATAGMLRIPIVMTIPLVGSGTIQGSVDDVNTFPNEACFLGYSLYCNGDWIYYKIKSHNGTSLNASLTWTDSKDDLDLYLYAPNGVLVNYSIAPSGTSEQVNLSNMVYDEYWVTVHAWNLSGTGNYNLTVSYPSGSQGNLQVSPSSWQGSVTKGGVKNITFTITNDAVAKSNLNLSVNRIAPGGSNFTEGTIDYTGSSYSIKWQVSNGSVNLNNSKFLNATLLWNNSSNDLDLKLLYYNGSSWVETRFESSHNNSQLGEAWEKLENVDVQHYFKNYPDFGVGIRNWGSSQTYNLTVKFTDIALWNAAVVNETNINLNSSEIKIVNVSIYTHALKAGEIYEALFLIQNNTEDFATVPVKLSVLSLVVNQSSPPCTGGSAYYSNISSAVIDANAGTNTILVCDGTYIETVTVNKSINIQSYSGSLATILDANGGIGFYVNASSVNITGFTIKNATGNNAAGIYLNGTSYSNISSNNLTSNNFGIYIESSNSNTVTNNFLSSNNYGIYLRNSSSNTIINNSITNSTQYDFYSTENSHVVDYNKSINTTKISFEGKDIAVKAALVPDEDPPGLINISKYINITNTSVDSWIFLNISYGIEDLGTITESTLKIYRHNGTSWENITGVNNVSAAGKYVYANITNFSVFAPMGRDITPPTITYVSPTPSGGASLSSSTTSVTINVTLDETPDKCTLTWDNVNESMARYGSGSNSYCEKTKTVSAGKSYTFKVWANDSSENLGNESERTFSVQSAPAPSGGGGGGGGGGGRISPIKEGVSALNSSLMKDIISNLDLEYKFYFDAPKTLAGVLITSDEYPAVDPEVASVLIRTIQPLQGDVYEIAAEKILENFMYANTLYIARGDIPPDSMAAVPYAKMKHVPIILTKTVELPEPILKAINKLQPKKIIIVGGPMAISNELEDELSSMAEVERIWGETRCETSVEMANSFASYYKYFNTMVITDGNDPSTDAAIIASGYKAPLLYVRGNEIPQDVKTFLEEHKTEYFGRQMKILTVGVTDEVGAEIEELMES